VSAVARVYAAPPASRKAPCTSQIQCKPVFLFIVQAFGTAGTSTNHTKDTP